MEPRNRNDARVVIAVIEAQQLSPAAYDCNPQARLTVQGASTVSEAETKKLSQTKDPFWNEKFVFGIDEENMDDLNIVAQINSDGRVVGTVADIPVKTLLNGQRMSLPTVNQGREIYCVDGWFEVCLPTNLHLHHLCRRLRLATLFTHGLQFGSRSVLSIVPSRCFPTGTRTGSTSRW